MTKLLKEKEVNRLKCPDREAALFFSVFVGKAIEHGKYRGTR